MPEKSNNGGSKDNDRWKVKAIPFPPSAERRDTGFREYQPGVLYPRSGSSSPTSPQPTQGGWSKWSDMTPRDRTVSRNCGRPGHAPNPRKREYS